MPVVRVTLIEGYPAETRRLLGERLTAAVRGTMAAPLEGITVAIEEVRPDNYMRGGTSRVPGAPSPDPQALVRGFLEAMEARDLARASEFLAEGFVMTFPGGVSFSRPEELAAWAKGRYRFVRKTYEGFDTALGVEGATVFCFGTLSGEWPDGTAFSGVRFIDRFEVEAGKLTRQMVWNDLAEALRR